MSEFWAVHTSGFMDMRGASGPYPSMPDAKKARDKLPTYERNGFRVGQSWVGDWFAIHRDSPDDGDAMTMVDGPHKSRDEAEKERLKNVNDQQAFLIDCNNQIGFVARVVDIDEHGRAIVERK